MYLSQDPIGLAENVGIQVNSLGDGSLKASWFGQKGKTDAQVNKAIKHIQKELNKNNKILLEKMSEKAKKALGLDTGKTEHGVAKLNEAIKAIDNILAGL